MITKKISTCIGFALALFMASAIFTARADAVPISGTDSAITNPTGNMFPGRPLLPGAHYPVFLKDITVVLPDGHCVRDDDLFKEVCVVKRSEHPEWFVGATAYVLPLPGARWMAAWNDPEWYAIGKAAITGELGNDLVVWLANCGQAYGNGNCIDQWNWIVVLPALGNVRAWGAIDIQTDWAKAKQLPSGGAFMHVANTFILTSTDGRRIACRWFAYQVTNGDRYPHIDPIVNEVEYVEAMKKAGICGGFTDW